MRRRERSSTRLTEFRKAEMSKECCHLLSHRLRRNTRRRKYLPDVVAFALRHITDGNAHSMTSIV